MCWLGVLLNLLLIGCSAFVVLGIPLFYTAITRWLASDGRPVVDAEGLMEFRGEIGGGVASSPAATVGWRGRGQPG